MTVLCLTAYKRGVRLVISACVLLLVSSVLAGCGGLSTKQRLARREATQLFAHVGLGSGHPKITRIEIRGGNWADVYLQGNFKGQSASRARLGFALRDPRHHWNVSYDSGQGFPG